MKTYYTKNEIQRIATEKAIEILNKDKEMLLNNTSYGGGFSKEVLIGLTNGDDWNKTKEIFIALDRKDWREDTINLSVFEYNHGKHKLIEIINNFYEIRTIKGTIYLTDKDDYERHKERQANKYDEKRKDMIIKMDTPLNEKIKNRIQSETRKKIKKQDFTIIKRKNGYIVYYDYRGMKKDMYI